jgi:hypothetical protein
MKEPTPKDLISIVLGVLFSTLIGIFGPLVSLILAAFIAGAITGAWLIHKYELAAQQGGRPWNHSSSVPRRLPRHDRRPCYERRLLRPVRISLIRISGCSKAAKCPPLLASP